MIQRFVVEVIATGILMFMTCAVWDSRNVKYGDSVAIKIGLTVSVICMAVGPYTGCSMNPARSFGPALWNNSWLNHWIFWFGPITGSFNASALYKTIFWPKEHELGIVESITLTSIESENPEVKNLQLYY